jgi:NAD-reducing hydrogenase small subunit
MTKPRLATVWLAGCSGCHMSFLDLDEWLIDLAQAVDLVYSPIADVKDFPHDVDVTLVEGAVANADNLELLHQVRERSKIVISFGDCAVHGNVTAMRNPLGDPGVLVAEAYKDAVTALHGHLPSPDGGIVPALLPRVLAAHEVVHIDAFLPGCPPSADRIRTAVEALLGGASPELAPEQRRFG